MYVVYDRVGVMYDTVRAGQARFVDLDHALDFAQTMNKRAPQYGPMRVMWVNNDTPTREVTRFVGGKRITHEVL